MIQSNLKILCDERDDSLGRLDAAYRDGLLSLNFLRVFGVVLHLVAGAICISFKLWITAGICFPLAIFFFVLSTRDALQQRRMYQQARALAAVNWAKIIAIRAEQEEQWAQQADAGSD